jgi:hypothetical protein
LTPRRMVTATRMVSVRMMRQQAPGHTENI